MAALYVKQDFSSVLCEPLVFEEGIFLGVTETILEWKQPGFPQMAKELVFH